MRRVLDRAQTPRGIGREESAAAVYARPLRGRLPSTRCPPKAGCGIRGAFSAEWPPFQRRFLSFIPIIGLNHECSKLGECQVADRDIGNTRGPCLSSSPVPTIAGGTADQ